MRVLGKTLKKNLQTMFVVLIWAFFLASGDLSANDRLTLAPGTILIANEALNDPNFDSAVVYIVGYNPLGTLGLIINRPLPNDDDIYFGGPISVEGPRALAASRFTIADAIHITDELYFLDNEQTIEDLMEKDREDAVRAIRVYRGISSWIPGQLEAEIQAGAWYVQNGSENIVFSDSERLWEELISRIHSQWVQSNDSVNALRDMALRTYNRTSTRRLTEK